MPPEELTWREQEVLALLAERLTNREIAARLHLAESTVKDYVSNILGKLYVKNRRQAVERAKALGLLEPAKEATFEPRTKLPADTTPFIGRLAELEDIRDLLGKVRLLTLIGPGGIGKTRLALKVVAEVADDFENGSFFISLAPIRSVDQIVQTISEALKFPLATHEDPLQQLLRYLKKKRLLLVMDNFEHLLSGVDIVSEILQAAQAVKVLATSRERLNLQSETILNIGGMILPDRIESADILKYDAITLFLQNARKVRPAFEPSPDELEKIANICRYVQGLPLAIELSAGWLHMLSMDEIVGELNKGFDILSTEMRDTPARHRSIRAVFDHSWSLLNPTEQEVFRILSVFRGGFAIEAAKRVAGASLPLLRGLVNKSILLYGSDSGHFEIHELLRQYAQERLEMTPQAGLSAYEAHAAYYAEFMQQKWADLRDSRQVIALNEINADIENIRAAWLHYMDKADAAQMQKFLNSFWLVYWIKGWNLAAVRLFKNAVDTLTEYSNEEVAKVVRAHAMANQAFFLAWLGLAEEGYNLAKKSIEILEPLKEPNALYFAYHGLTLPAYYLAHLQEEIEATDKMLDIASALGDRWLLALAYFLSSIVNLRMINKDYPSAEQLAFASLKESEAIEDLTVQALSLSALGHIATLRHIAKGHAEFTSAKAYYLSSLHIAERLGFRWAIGNTVKYLGSVALLGGEISEAEQYFLRSLRIADDLGLHRDIANHLYEFAKLRAAQDRSAEAVELLALLSQLPVSQQARLGSVRIRDIAKEFLAKLEEDLSPETFAAALERGRKLDLDEVLSGLLTPNQEHRST